jgi:hypothetical protein
VLAARKGARRVQGARPGGGDEEGPDAGRAGVGVPELRLCRAPHNLSSGDWGKVEAAYWCLGVRRKRRDAASTLAGICAGGGAKGQSLPPPLVSVRKPGERFGERVRRSLHEGSGAGPAGECRSENAEWGLTGRDLSQKRGGSIGRTSRIGRIRPVGCGARATAVAWRSGTPHRKAFTRGPGRRVSPAGFGAGLAPQLSVLRRRPGR